MKSTLSAKRKGDALITLRQNTIQKRIEVVRMNRAAESLIGYSSDELVGLNINKFIPVRIAQSIDEYVDFVNHDNDFADVVRRIPNFQIINKQGRTMPVSLKVFHLVSEVADSPEYEILIRDISLLSKMEELKSKLIESGQTKGVLTANEFRAVYDIIYNFVEKEFVEIIYAVVAIDGFDSYLRKYSTNTIDSFVDNVAKNIVNTCRDDDAIGYLGNGLVGIALLDCGSLNAQSVLARVSDNVTRNAISLDNGSKLNINLSVSYMQINPEYAKDAIYKACIEDVSDVQLAGGNMIHAV